MKCSSCGSDHTQKLSVIYEAGSQTVLAQKIAPPKKAKPAWAGFWISLGGFGFFILILAFATSGDTHGAVSPLLGWLFFIPAVVMIARGVSKAKKYNDTVWREHYNLWLTAWYCHKCGTVFD
ncbi:hypothetical protein ACN262_32860 [Burkholderia gladioli]|uniref:hypothetical protein n=1 Tax=Burkholderia gladioli TaxID=28095 RepID=UPI001640FB57|nr:hypothetical protein [Burkholderia gladioli]